MGSNMQDDMAEEARGIVAGAYVHHKKIGDKLRYIKRRMEYVYPACTWNVLANVVAHEVSTEYWAHVAARHDLFIWTHFYIFSTFCQ